jgi:hypothetical protein
MATNKAQGDWGEYRTLILAELKRLNEGIDAVKSKVEQLHASDIGNIKAEIAVLKVKAAIVGAVAGAVPAAASLIYTVLHK